MRSDHLVLFSFPSTQRPLYPVTVHPKSCLLHVILLACYRLVSKQPQDFSVRHLKFLQDYSPVCILRVALFLCESEQLEGRDLVSPCTSVPNVIKYFSTSLFFFLCVCTCVNAGMPIYASVHMQNLEVDVTCLPLLLPTWIFDAGSLTGSGVYLLGYPNWPIRPWNPHIPCAHPLGSQAHTAMPDFQWLLGT